MAAKIDVIYRFGKWWLFDNNNDQGARLHGPYSTKKEAEEDRKGLARFWKSEFQKEN